MRLTIAFLLCAALAGCGNENAKARLADAKEKQAEVDKAKTGYDGLMKAKTDGEFDRRLDALAHEGTPASIEALTRALLALPYEPELDRPGGTVRMRKLKVMRELDRLLPIPERDQLAARYSRVFRKEGPAAKTAGEALVRWAEENKDTLRWDPYLQRFDLRPSGELKSLRTD